AGREHRVGGVLGEFRRAARHHHDPVAIALEWRIELAHLRLCLRILDAEDDAIGLHEILDRRAFLEELRVRHHRERDLDTALGEHLADGGLDAVRRADRHRALVDHHPIVLDVLPDGPRHRQHVAEVRRPVLVRRGAHRDHDHLAEGDRLLGRQREAQAAGLHVGGDDALEARLVDRDVPLAQAIDLDLVGIDAQHLVPAIGQAGTCHETDISRPDHAHFHRYTLHRRANGDQGRHAGPKDTSFRPYRPTQSSRAADMRATDNDDPSRHVLVTGAAGFIGMHSCIALLERGYRVHGIDNLNAYYPVSLKEDRIANIRRHPRAERFEFTRLDIADAEAVRGLFEESGFSHILHLAAQAGVRHSIEHPFDYTRSNLVGMSVILEAARAARVRHLVYASSSSVYGGNTRLPFSEDDRVDRPVSFYAATKRANEAMAYSYAHLYAIPCTGLRFFTVYGPWGRPDIAAWLFTDAILAGRPIRLFEQGRL